MRKSEKQHEMAVECGLQHVVLHQSLEDVDVDVAGEFLGCYLILLDYISGGTECMEFCLIL